MDQYLTSIYYDVKHPASFSSPTKLYRAAAAEGMYYSYQQIKHWLSKQEPYTLHKPVNRKFPRNKVVVSGIGDQWDADLIDFSRVSKNNKGVGYILVIIDIFSRFLWLRPLKTKTGLNAAKAFEKVFLEGRRPKYLRTDKGQEFKARVVQEVFKRYNIRHFVTQNEVKATYAERVIKTIRSKIYRYFTANQTRMYIDILPDLAKSYNNTYHRRIEMSPAEVTKQNETSLWWKLYWPYLSQRTFKKFGFHVGDYVRITHLRTPFSKEYDEKWSGEIFKVSACFRPKGLPIYTLIDFHDEGVTGTFYQEELQKVESNDLWRVEKIIKEKGRGLNKMVYVKWLYWPGKFNQWIKASDLQDL